MLLKGEQIVTSFGRCPNDTGQKTLVARPTGAFASVTHERCGDDIRIAYQWEGLPRRASQSYEGFRYTPPSAVPIILSATSKEYLHIYETCPTADYGAQFPTIPCGTWS